MRNLFCALFLLLTIAVNATDYFVDVAVGNDGNLGTSAGAGNAWQTLGKAATTVAADDTVNVEPSGEYIVQDGATGAVLQIRTVGTLSAPIAWVGNGLVTLNAGTNGLTNCLSHNSLTGVTYNKFKNFRFTGAASDGVDLDGPDRMSFENCRSDNHGGIGFSGDNNFLFVACEADNNTGPGFDTDTTTMANGCIARTNSGNGFISRAQAHIGNSLFCDNGDTSIIIFHSSLVSNCTIDGGNSQVGIGVAGPMCAVVNSIIYDCTTGINDLSSREQGQISKNNLFFSNDTDRTNWPSDASDIAADPLFVDADANDYRLSAGSPALAAGIDVGSIDGITSTSFIDVGAQQAEATGSVIVIDD